VTHPVLNRTMAELLEELRDEGQEVNILKVDQ
jgi:hypothetical protein